MRLKEYDYSQSGTYFLTICVEGRECLFGEIADGEVKLNEYGVIARQCWEAIPIHFSTVELDEYITMPNHIHGIINIVGARHAVPLQIERFGKPIPGSLSTVVRSYKSAVTKRINGLRNKLGTVIRQRNYYEHVIRSDVELGRSRQYIVENPLKWDIDSENPKR